MRLMSVILPAYNEEKMVDKAVAAIGDVLENAGIPYEIVLVNDGSKDATWERIEEVSKSNPTVRGICFSRNFGKESAIFAGLESAKGDCCVVMDCDLQHPPEILPEMYRLWQDGYEVVEGVKRSRGKEGFFHKVSAGVFYQLISKAVHIDMSRASDFKLLDRKAVEALLDMPERNVFFRALSSWVGYRSTMVEFDVQERREGESKWTTGSLIRYAITNITSFSTAPMQIVTWLGIIMLIFTLIMTVQTLICYFTGNALEGFTTVLLLILLIGSILMIGLGITGHYIAKIYDEVKQRPRYLVEKKTENRVEK